MNGKTMNFCALRKYAKRKRKLKDWACMAFGFFLAMFLFHHIYCWVSQGVRFVYREWISGKQYLMYNSRTELADRLYFFENGAHGCIRKEDRKDERTIVEDVTWVLGAEREDSLVCFASGGYRGFFNRLREEVEIPADRYRKAWLFSEGVAAVSEDNDHLVFINPAGKVVIDKGFRLAPISASYGYLFRNGYCPMTGTNGKWGLIDKKGNWMVSAAYDEVRPADGNCWIVKRNDRIGLLNEQLKMVVAPIFRNVCVTDFGIEVLKEDYSRQLLDGEGNVIQKFLYTDLEELIYKTKVNDAEIGDYEWVLSPYKVYQTTDDDVNVVRVGLLSPEGKPLTPPSFSSIRAVNERLFQCFYGDLSSVLIDTNGRIVESTILNSDERSVTP